jgi:hypothetical protein
MKMLNLRDIHTTLERMGFPVEEVRRESDAAVSVTLIRKATETQRERAQGMVNVFVDSGREDFAEFAAGYVTALEALPTVEDIQANNKTGDLRAMAVALRTYIDQYVH